ncbi:MAG: putative phosphohistidine phosphatase, SixA [Actinobacteria bacterium]|jgi:phosphohistidine phosphatase|nr:putative phosphohistidine phosphatase, SixA [Actinomycetota bacterium]
MDGPKLLYLLRHAKSDWDDQALADRDRPLAPRGRKAASALAGHIERSGISPALVLCSPARRTMDTLRLISGSFRDPVEILVEEELYGAGMGELLRRLRRVDEATPSVMLIGHNPAIHELAVALARSVDDLEQLKRKFPTGAMATLAVPGAWKDLGADPADLLEFALPRELN